MWCDDDRSWEGKIPKEQQRFFPPESWLHGGREKRKKLCCQRKERGRKKAEVFMGEICTKDSLVASKILPRAPPKGIC